MRSFIFSVICLSLIIPSANAFSLKSRYKEIKEEIKEKKEEADDKIEKVKEDIEVVKDEIEERSEKVKEKYKLVKNECIKPFVDARKELAKQKKKDYKEIRLAFKGGMLNVEEMRDELKATVDLFHDQVAQLEVDFEACKALF